MLGASRLGMVEEREGGNLLLRLGLRCGVVLAAVVDPGLDPRCFLLPRTGEHAQDSFRTINCWLRVTPAILGGNKEVQEFVEIPQIPASALRLE